GVVYWQKRRRVVSKLKIKVKSPTLNVAKSATFKDGELPFFPLLEKREKWDTRKDKPYRDSQGGHYAKQENERTCKHWQRRTGIWLEETGRRGSARGCGNGGGLRGAADCRRGAGAGWA